MGMMKQILIMVDEGKAASEIAHTLELPLELVREIVSNGKEPKKEEVCYDGSRGTGATEGYIG
jgi:hypothetical protein